MNTRLAGIVLGVALLTFVLVLTWGVWSLTRLDSPTSRGVLRPHGKEQ